MSDSNYSKDLSIFVRFFNFLDYSKVLLERETYKTQEEIEMNALILSSEKMITREQKKSHLGTQFMGSKNTHNEVSLGNAKDKLNQPKVKNNTTKKDDNLKNQKHKKNGEKSIAKLTINDKKEISDVHLLEKKKSEFNGKLQEQVIEKETNLSTKNDPNKQTVVVCTRSSEKINLNIDSGSRDHVSLTTHLISKQTEQVPKSCKSTKLISNSKNHDTDVKKLNEIKQTCVDQNGFSKKELKNKHNSVTNKIPSVYPIPNNSKKLKRNKSPKNDENSKSKSNIKTDNIKPKLCRNAQPRNSSIIVTTFQN